MTYPLRQEALDRAFLVARTFNKFTAQTVDEELLHRLYDVVKWALHR